MAKQVKRSKQEIATIDCSLITIETATGEFGFDTANQIQVEPQIDEQENITLIVKGILRAQKPAISVITGNQITLTDNVFNPELVLVLQGGEILYDPNNPDEIVGYNPPLSGSGERGAVFKLNAYTAQYDSAGLIVKYEKITYPNCQGVPMGFGSEDGVFRIPEYTINSAPKSDEPPYSIEYVKQLPVLVDQYSLGTLTLTSTPGTATGSTKITVAPVKNVYTNKYFYQTAAAAPTLPVYGTVLSTGWTEWDGIADISATNGNSIAVIEADSDSKALAGGIATVVSAT
jgi:hypothetical protein